MTEHAEPLEPETDAAGTSPIQRKALLAGGAAAVAAAAVVALATADKADAGHNTDVVYDSQDVMHVDVTNTTAGSTRVSSNISGSAAFVALNNYPVGISRPDGMLGRTAYITSNCAGVAGTCEAASGGLGVMGTSKAADGTGVYGYSGSVVPSTISPAGTGVYASGPNFGVYALARDATGVAVRGESATGTAVQGNSTSGTAIDGTSTAGSGVVGRSTAASGVQGICAAGNGVRGETTSGVGVLGIAEAAGIAGRFVGRTVVEGALAAGTVDASGAVHLAATLEVTGQATLAGLKVAGPATFTGAVTLPEGSKLDKLALPKTSGVVTLGKAAASVVVPKAPVVSGTLVVATLQKHVKGLWIEAAVPAVAGKKITIHFNKRAPKGTKVAWMLVN